MRENYRLYKLYKMIQKNNGGEQPSVNVDAFLGLKPIKKLTLSNNQDKLVNHYIEKFSTCQSFEDIPYYKLTFNAKPEGDEDPTTLQFSYLYLQPYLISTPINLYAEYPVWVDYYNRNYTVAFIQLDEAMGFGFTENFLKEKNITKEELLQMDGWYDRQLQPYTGVLEYTNLVPVFASIENAASMVGMAEAPENAIKNCYTFDDFYLSVDVEYCDTVEEEEDLINYFVNRDFMNITTATNNDICEGTTAYIDGRLIEGGLREIENELVFDNTRRNAVNLDDNNLLWIESDTTNQDYVVRNGTSMKVAADASQTANAIGLTADKILEGNIILGIAGAAKLGEGTKVFNTIEEMEASDAEEGDFAVVYKIEEKELTQTTEFSKVIFPETVVLPGKAPQNGDPDEIVAICFKRVDGIATEMDNCYGEFRDNQFYLHMSWANGAACNVEYESEDSITYTRTNLYTGTTMEYEENPASGLFDAGYKLKAHLEPVSEVNVTWHDYIKYFMILPPEEYMGTFKYVDGEWKEYSTGTNTNDANATMSDLMMGTFAYVNGIRMPGCLEEESSLQDGASWGNYASVKTASLGYGDNKTDILEVTNTIDEYRKVLQANGTVKLRPKQSDVATAIGLTADQIIKGNTVLGVEGTGTTDATATAEEIASGYTAYVNGEKITGAVNMVTKGSTMGYIANSGELDGNNVGFKYVFTTTEGFRPDSNIKLYLNKSKVAALIGLTADKIKKGETILGITGTYEGDFTETVTPEEYTQAETQISDLFGEEV